MVLLRHYWYYTFIAFIIYRAQDFLRHIINCWTWRRYLHGSRRFNVHVELKLCCCWLNMFTSAVHDDDYESNDVCSRCGLTRVGARCNENVIRRWRIDNWRIKTTGSILSLYKSLSSTFCVWILSACKVNTKFQTPWRCLTIFGCILNQVSDGQLISIFCYLLLSFLAALTFWEWRSILGKC